MRLAFAVAAHLEPEILIVDEVLAVGDAEFQKKCLGKMDEVSRSQGRTVLFVSHNMAIISSLCQRAFWLDQGSLIDSGAVNEVLRTYHAHKQQSANEEHVVTTSALRWRGLQNRTSLDGLRNDEDLLLELGFESGQDPLNNMQVDIALVDEREQVSLHCRSKFVRKPISVPANTSFVISYVLRSPRLAPGHYHLTVYATTGARELCWVDHVDACRISAASPFFSDAILDNIKGATVPDFSLDVALHSACTYATSP